MAPKKTTEEMTEVEHFRAIAKGARLLNMLTGTATNQQSAFRENPDLAKYGYAKHEPEAFTFEPLGECLKLRSG